MVRQHITQQPQKEVVQQLINRRPLLQHIVPNQKTEHEGEPTIDGKRLVPIAQKRKAKADFYERYCLQVGVHEGRGQLDS